MFEVRNSDNEVILKTADRDLAELVMYACSIARNSFHKVLDLAGDPFKISLESRDPNDFWNRPLASQEFSRF